MRELLTFLVVTLPRWWHAWRDLKADVVSTSWLHEQKRSGVI